MCLIIVSYHMTGGTCIYHVKETQFPKVSFIDQPLLEDIIRCYNKGQIVCRNCFYSNFKLSRSVTVKGNCSVCYHKYNELLVIPKSSMTVNHYKSEMIAIPPWPRSKPNKSPFQSCAKPTDRSQDHR